jgi:hypothetical protein
MPQSISMNQACMRRIDLGSSLPPYAYGSR